MAWTLDTIDWARFDPAAVDPGVLALVKAAALVEANAPDYVAYLRNVFAGDTAFLASIDCWGTEEAQHGLALGCWAMVADPAWNFDRALADFRAGYRIEIDATASIRGSRAGELIARQVVETGTSSFYSALRDATSEPVLKSVASYIARDEFAHYRLFAKAAKSAPSLNLAARLRIAVTRFAEAGDDELGWAWFAANVLPNAPGATYETGIYSRAYAAQALRLYRREHIAIGIGMTLRAVSLRPDAWLYRLLTGATWTAVRVKVAFA